MVRIQHEPIETDRLLRDVRSDADGALTLFVGTVRNHNRGRAVRRLEYQAYAEMAEGRMARIEAELRRRFAISDVALVHRVGRLAIGEAAELAEDTELARRALDRDEERIPVETVDRLLEGENPIRVWRKYRGLTQRTLATRVGINTAYLSQIETGKRGGSSKVLRAIAKALAVDLDDIVPAD